MRLLKAAFDLPAVIAALRPLLDGAPVRSALLPGAVDREAAADMLGRARWRSFDLAHRGRYAFSAAPDPSLRAFAEALCGKGLSTARARLFRFGQGDYSLSADDAETRVPESVEVTADLSADKCGEGEVVYADGAARLVVPHQPGLVSVVVRTAGVYRHERYLTRAVGDAAIVRLRVAFPLARH